MAQNAKNVRIDAAPNVGAIAIAPAGTALPTDPTTALSGAFTYVGIIGSDGVTNTPSINSTDIEDMNGNVVATVETGSKTEVAFPMLETNEVSLGLYHGKDNVTRTSGGGGSEPDLITVQGGPIPTEHLVVVRDTVSNGLKRRTVWPDAKVTGREAEQVSGTAATVRSVTLTAFPYDGDGHTYLDYTQVPAASDESSSSSSS